MLLTLAIAWIANNLDPVSVAGENQEKNNLNDNNGSNGKSSAGKRSRRKKYSVFNCRSIKNIIVIYSTYFLY